MPGGTHQHGGGLQLVGLPNGQAVQPRCWAEAPGFMVDLWWFSFDFTGTLWGLMRFYWNVGWILQDFSPTHWKWPERAYSTPNTLQRQSTNVYNPHIFFRFQDPTDPFTWPIFKERMSHQFHNKKQLPSRWLLQQWPPKRQICVLQVSVPPLQNWGPSSFSSIDFSNIASKRALIFQPWQNFLRLIQFFTVFNMFQQVFHQFSIQKSSLPAQSWKPRCTCPVPAPKVRGTSSACRLVTMFSWLTLDLFRTWKGFREGPHQEKYVVLIELSVWIQNQKLWLNKKIEEQKNAKGCKKYIHCATGTPKKWVFPFK